MKQRIKGKICFVIHIAGEQKLLFYFYFVIVKQNFKNGALITTSMCSWNTQKGNPNVQKGNPNVQKGIGR